MKTNQKTLGVVRLVTVLLLSAMSSALLALAVISYASDPPPEQVFPNEQDFDDDGSVDDLVGDSASETEPGKLEFRSGASGQVILQYQGREGGDRFGEAAIVIGDVNWDGIPDLLVGAPREGNGAAYVFPGEVIACPVEVTVDEALLVLSPIEADFEFGFAVAALYDFDGDDTPDFRVAAKYLTPQQTIAYRTYIFSGYTGELLATVTGAGAFAALEPNDGDTDYDADVDDDDVDRVMRNMGRTGNLTRYDGDVNQDGVVDGADLSIVMAKHGFRAYDHTTSGTGCDPACVTLSPAPPEEYCLCMVEEEEHEVGATVEFADGLASGGVIFTPLPTPCGQTITDCLNHPVWGPIIQDALDLISERCCCGPGSNPSAFSFTVGCKDCPPGVPSGETKFKCDLFGRKIEVIICNNAANFCQTLAHELTHVSQACANDFYNSCANFKRWARNQYHRMCAEIEAAQVAQQCHDAHSCCDFVCGTPQDPAIPWRNCPHSCYDCCMMSWGCCQNGRNVCEDAGNNPCK